MKKVLAIIAAAAMVLSMSLVAFAEVVNVPATGSYTATKTTATITVDGVMDAAYNTAQAITFAAKDDAVNSSSAKMYLLNDGSYVYAFISVSDATYSKAYTELAWWDNVDSLWIGFNDTDCFAFARDNADAYRVIKGSAAITWAVQNVNGTTAVSMADARTGAAVTGYNVEVKIPYTGYADYKFGSFACIDNDAGEAGLVEGRIRTSEAVSCNSGGNGIWQDSQGAPWDGYTDQNGNPLSSASFYDTVRVVEPGPTGDSTNVMPYVIMLLVSAAAVVLFVRKRNA